MEPKPEVSIINLCYNTGEQVIDTLESIKKQTFRNFELIVVDDCSTDNSYFIIKNWLDEHANFPYRLFRNSFNSGIVPSLNFALHFCRGKYLSLIADDLWLCDFLETTLGYIKETTREIGLIYTKATVIDSDSGEIIRALDPITNAENVHYPRSLKLFEKCGKDLFFLPGEVVQDHLFWINPFISFSFLAKIEFFREGYSQKYWMEDLPKWYELSKKTNFLYLNIVKAKYVIHGKNVSLTKKYALNLGLLDFLFDHYHEINFGDTKHFVRKRITNLFSNKELTLRYLFHTKKINGIVRVLQKQPTVFFSIVGLILINYLSIWKRRMSR